MFPRNTLLSAATASLLLLAGCGTDPMDRAASGALIGGAAGAAIGSMSGDMGTGALIGAGVGAATGAISDPCKLNLGDPYWKERGRDEYERRCGRR